MSVPFIDLKRFEAGFIDEWMEKVGKLSSGAEYIGGAEVSDLEQRLATFTKSEFAISCGNGTDAIQLALRAVGVGRDDLVIVPNMTFWATFEAVVNVGGIPITVDSSLDDGGIDFDRFVEAVEKYNVKFAVIAHLYGWGTSQLKNIREYCRSAGITLIEDGAQCFGVTYEDKPIYQDAVISTTSFYPAKVLGAAGDGGAVFTGDKKLADKVRQLGNHGRTSHYGYGVVGWNSRLDTLQAAYLNLSLKYLPQRIESRRRSVMYYRDNITAKYLDKMQAPQGFRENGYCNVCLIGDERKKSGLEAVLKSSGIGFGNIYPGAMADQPGAEGYLHAHVGGDNAQRLSSSVLNLPLFAYMKIEELEEVVAIVNDFE